MFFNLFNRKKKEHPEFDFSSLKVDIHSHLIPGIDDGAQTLEDSVTLVRRITELGFQKIITTPHVMADYYRNTPEIINSGLGILKEELKKNDISVELEAAAEYYLDEAFETKLDQGNILTVGNHYLLFELSFINYPQSFFDTVAKIRSKGYQPVLAHPERYSYFGSAIENYERIKEAGCLLQLNAISLTGYYGKSTQKIAEELTDNNLVDFLGSDMHHLKHAEMLKSSLGLPYLEKLLAGHQLKNPLLLEEKDPL